MRIICPFHARERMEQRTITRKQIESAINSPNVTLPTQDKRRKRVMKTFGGRTLDVIFEPRGKDAIILVTAVWLKRENRKAKEQ